MRATVINLFKNRFNFFAVFVQFDEINISFLFLFYFIFYCFCFSSIKNNSMANLSDTQFKFFGQNYLIVKQLDMIRYYFEKHSMQHTFN